MINNVDLTSLFNKIYKSKRFFCKFLSANDTGATGGHQSGILISKSAGPLLFNQPLDNEQILKRIITIIWQDDFSTESCFTYYKSKNELRVTRFGRDFPFLSPDNTGDLFILIQDNYDYYSGYFLNKDNDIELFFNTFNISSTQTNKLIDVQITSQPSNETDAIQRFIMSLSEDFPSSEKMSLAARVICSELFDNRKLIQLDPDKKIIEWTDMEYNIFKALENLRYKDILEKVFSSVDDFIRKANIVLNRRKSRAGKSLEHHLSAIFDANNILYSSQAVTEGNKKPDFIFPSIENYHDFTFPVSKLATLAAKTTCKDRWRQILNEAGRIKKRYLCTLQQGISPAQMDEMQAENVTLVVPRCYISSYPKDKQKQIWSIRQFVDFIKEMEGL